MTAAPPPPSWASPAVAFADVRHGWASGSGGILGTTDGRTWRVEFRLAAYGLDAVDAETAWAVTANGSIVRTQDGHTWTAVAGPRVSRVSFADRRRGIALTLAQRVVITDNGGSSWRTHRLRMSDVCALGGSLLAARGGSVWRSGDRGRSWRRVRLLPDRQGFPIPQLACRDRDAWVVLHEGAAAGTEGYRVYRSLDGGRTWRAVLASPSKRGLPPISNYAGPLAVVGRGTAVLVGRCDPCGRYEPTATVVRTTDGGRSFSRWTPFDGYWPYSVSFVDARHGWLLTGDRRAHDAVVWATATGGRTWRRVLRSRAIGAPA